MLLNDLSLDCIVEISKHLHPIDIYRLSKCNKRLSFLLSSNKTRFDEFRKTHPITCADFFDKIFSWFYTKNRYGYGKSEYINEATDSNNFFLLALNIWLKTYIHLFEKMLICNQESFWTSKCGWQLQLFKKKCFVFRFKKYMIIFYNDEWYRNNFVTILQIMDNKVPIYSDPKFTYFNLDFTSEDFITEDSTPLKGYLQNKIL